MIEPLRRTRVVLDDNPSGLACDLTFSAHGADPGGTPDPVAGHPPHDGHDPLRSVRSVVGDGTPSRRRADCRRLVRTKDRSWACGVGEPETGGVRPPGGIFFLWRRSCGTTTSPMHFLRRAAGRPWCGGDHRAALPARRTCPTPSRAPTSAWPAPPTGCTTTRAPAGRPRRDRPDRPGRADPHDRAGARAAPSMKGLGYVHPEWGRGAGRASWRSAASRSIRRPAAAGPREHPRAAGRAGQRRRAARASACSSRS